MQTALLQSGLQSAAFRVAGRAGLDGGTARVRGGGVRGPLLVLLVLLVASSQLLVLVRRRSCLVNENIRMD